MTGTTLAIGILTGAIGTGYFMYGKRQTKFVPPKCFQPSSCAC